MSKRIGIITILVLFLLNVSAQKKLNYVGVDKTSYVLFQQKKWDELIDYSAKARKQGIDYFYLQARTGIAYYNLKKYRHASDYFLKAWKNDKSFEWLQEYLYYALLFSGRGSEANKVAVDFSVAMKQKINFQYKKPLRVAAEAGFSFNPDFETLTKATHYQQAKVGENYGEAFYLKNYHFESLDYSHQLTPGVNLNHNFTYIGVNREEQLFWGSLNSFPVKINQYQYFINPVFVLGKKIYVSPSANFVWGKTNTVLGDYTPNSFYSSDVKYSDFIFSISAWSHFGNFAPGIEINRANIYNENFTQLSSWITFYPLSNANFYITPRVYFKVNSNQKINYNTFGISGGVQLGAVHFYGQYLNGDMENFIEASGYVIANFPGKSTRKFTGALYFPLTKKYQFVVRYMNQDIIEKYQVYVNGTPNNTVDYNYIKHTLTGGISWSF